MFSQINLKTLHISTSIEEAQKKYNQNLNDLIKNNPLSDVFLFKNRSLVFNKTPEYWISPDGVTLFYPLNFSLRVALFQIDLLSRFFNRIDCNIKNLKLSVTKNNDDVAYCYQIKHPILIWKEPNAFEWITPDNPFIPDFQTTTNQMSSLISKNSAQLALNEQPLFLTKETEYLVNFIKILSYEIGMIVKENKNIQLESLQKNMYHAILRNKDSLTTQIEELMELLNN